MMRPLCTLQPGPYGDTMIVTPPGYRSCRVIDGNPCNCTVAYALDDGTCPCAPGNYSVLLAILPITKPKEQPE
jgi:hypothetical protein